MYSDPLTEDLTELLVDMSALQEYIFTAQKLAKRRDCSNEALEYVIALAHSVHTKTRILDQLHDNGPHIVESCAIFVVRVNELDEAYDQGLGPESIYDELSDVLCALEDVIWDVRDLIK